MSKTIMLIDDSYTLRQMVSMTLSREGYEILQAENGKDALKKLEGQKVDLILCDVNMPEMDGISFVKEIKKNDEYKYTPIMMLTTETEQSVKEDAKELGIKLWMVKPFQPPIITEAVKKLLRP